MKGVEGMRRTMVLLAAMLASILLFGVRQGPARADVTGVEGGAFGYYLNVSIFGSPSPPWDRLPQ
jgi:hypothetical protein